MLERAYLLNLTAQELTVLVGGMRALGANFDRSEHGVFTDRPETLTNDFFVDLLAGDTEWKASESSEGVFEIRNRATDELKHTATAVDLVFGSNSQLRAISEIYGSDDAREKFMNDFRRRLGQGHGVRPVRSSLTSGHTAEAILVVPQADPSRERRMAARRHRVLCRSCARALTMARPRLGNRRAANAR